MSKFHRKLQACQAPRRKRMLLEDPDGIRYRHTATTKFRHAVVKSEKRLHCAFCSKTMPGTFDKSKLDHLSPDERPAALRALKRNARRHEGRQTFCFCRDCGVPLCATRKRRCHDRWHGLSVDESI